MWKVLFIVHQIVTFIACGLVLGVQNEIGITKTFILFYVVIGINALIPFVLPRGVFSRIFKNQDKYFFITTFPILFVALILMWQHWDIYGEIIKDFLS